MEEKAQQDGFVEKAFRELAECSICCDIFDEPKMLQCLHSFCLKCLTTYGERNRTGKNIACPICRQTFEIPDGGYSAIPANFFVNRIKELYQTSRPNLGQPVALCEVCGCGNDGEAKNANVENYCIECNQRLCSKCSTLHKQFAISRMHQVVAIGNESSMKDLLKTRSSPCEVHPKENVQLYCIVCKKVICLLCFALKHNGHNCETIEAVAEQQRKLLDYDLKAVSGKMTELKKLEEAVEELKLNLFKSVENAESQIHRTSEELIKLVTSHRDKAMEELMEHKQLKTKDLVQRQQELEMEKSLMESFYQFASVLKEDATDAEVTVFGENTHQKAQLFLTKEPPVLPSKTTVEVVFRPSVETTKSLRKLNNIIGMSSFRQEETKKPQDPSTSLQQNAPIQATKSSTGANRPTPVAPVQVTKTFITEIPGSGCILGITVLMGQVFVCRQRSPNVDVFNLDSFEKLRAFTVKDLKDPTDMTSWPTMSSMYINGQEDLCIYKIKVDGTVLDRWKMKEKSFRISVDADGLVTATFRDTLCIRVFDSSGAELITVNLPQDMKSPRNAFFVDGERFVVCHGELHEPLHRVCELDIYGKIIRWYGGAEGSDKNLINVPVHMIRAPGRDRYLVADLNNHRVHLIQDFRLVTHLLTTVDGGIKTPRKLELCNNLLFVAQDSGQCRVFDVTI